MHAMDADFRHARHTRLAAGRALFVLGVVITRFDAVFIAEFRQQTVCRPQAPRPIPLVRRRPAARRCSGNAMRLPMADAAGRH